MNKLKKILIALTVIVAFLLLFVGCDDDEYERDFNRALNKPYNELTSEEREMMDGYIEWQVEQNQ